MSLPTLQGIKDSAGAFIKNPVVMVQKAINVQLITFLFVGIALILIVGIWYYRQQINKKANDNYLMGEIYKKSTVVGNINPEDVNFKVDAYTGTGHVRDYYIASSYNSCCAGDFQDSYVDLVPLREVIHQGARVLDFELYMVDGDVVVGAGATDSDNIKGTYNSLPVGGTNGILNIINNSAFELPTPNPTDPLFVHFRIKSKSNPQLFYKKLTAYVKEWFGPRLLAPEYGHEGRPGVTGASKNIAAEPLINFQNKIIIYVIRKPIILEGQLLKNMLICHQGLHFYLNIEIMMCNILMIQMD